MLRHEFLVLDRERGPGTVRMVPMLRLLMRSIAVRRLALARVHVARLLVPVTCPSMLVKAMPAHLLPPGIR
jgi:hypothetical protein